MKNTCISALLALTLLATPLSTLGLTSQEASQQLTAAIDQGDAVNVQILLSTGLVGNPKEFLDHAVARLTTITPDKAPALVAIVQTLQKAQVQYDNDPRMQTIRRQKYALLLCGGVAVVTVYGFLSFAQAFARSLRF